MWLILHSRFDKSPRCRDLRFLRKLSVVRF